MPEKLQWFSNAMEVHAAKIMCRRSVERYGLKYTSVLCDGDSKTIIALNNAAIYDEEIIKQDCINYIAKRMYNGITTISNNLKGTADSISGDGLGKVTKKKQTLLTQYYAHALKTYAPDVDAMRKGVLASLYHFMSSDDKPQHQHCLPGESSWCRWQRCQVTGEQYEHHQKIIEKYAVQLLPLYERLTKPDLLERCSEMKTQNANESFNAQMWCRCPKILSASLKTVETAVCLASLEFNAGPNALCDFIREIGITDTYYIDMCTALLASHRRVLRQCLGRLASVGAA